MAQDHLQHGVAGSFPLSDYIRRTYRVGSSHPEWAVAGDYFLMQGETPNSLYLFVRGNASSVTGERRIGRNRQYIIYTDENQPVEWKVIAVEGHKRFKIHDIERAQDSKFREIVSKFTVRSLGKGKDPKFTLNNFAALTQRSYLD